MTQRDRIMISVVLLLVLIGGYWMLLLTPKREAAADAEAKVATAQTALDTARGQLTSGQKAAESFRKDRATVVKLGRVVPGTDDAKTVLIQLQTIAKREKVAFTSYSVESAGGTAAPATPVTTETAVSPTGDATAAKSTSAVAPLYPPGSVEMAGGLGRSPLKIELEAPYFKLERYLRAVQRFAVVSAENRKSDGRLFIVDGIDYSRVASTDAEGTPGASKATTKLKAAIYASVYFAPPIEAPAAPGAGGTAAPPAGTAAGSTTTPPASIGTLR